MIKKKLVRKVLDMLKKIEADHYDEFWKEFSTNIKLGVMEDPSNRTRLAKLLRFQSSHAKTGETGALTTLSAYVERMKEKQDAIFYVAGTSRKEVGHSFIHFLSMLSACRSRRRPLSSVFSARATKCCI